MNRSVDSSFARPTRLACLLALPLMFVPVFVRGASFGAGDVLVGGRPAYAVSGGNAYVDKFTSTGQSQTHVAILLYGHPRDMVSLGGDVVVADEQQLTRIRSDGTVSLAAPVFFEAYAGSMAISANGDIYVGDLLGRGVTKIPSEPGPALHYVVPVLYPGILALDLQADQCTLLYASRGAEIQRYDVCKNKALADFAHVSVGFVLSIRILPSRDVLVGSTDGLTRFNSAGEIVQTYVPGVAVTRISVVPNEDAIWIGGVTRNVFIEKVDLFSGQVLIGPVEIVGVGGSDAFGPEALLVVGDQRVAQMVSIPTLSPFGLIGLAIALSVVALRRVVN